MVPNFRPELLNYVKRKAERNLFRRVAECVSRRVSDAWKPGRGHRRGGVIGGKIGNVQCGVAIVVVSQEAVKDSVEGATLEAVVTGRNVADILMKKGCQGRLKSALKNAIAGARGHPTAKTGEAAAPLAGSAVGLVKQQSGDDGTEVRACGAIGHLKVKLPAFRRRQGSVIRLRGKGQTSYGVYLQPLLFVHRWGRVRDACRRDLARGGCLGVHGVRR